MRLASLLGPDLKLLLKEDPEQARAVLEDMHPEDIADLVSELDPEEAAALLQHLPAEDAAPIFERLEGDEQEEIAELLPTQSVAQIASEMAPDDRADLFSVLPEKMGDEVLQLLEKVDPEAAEEVREIEKWPETAAGHLMTTAYVHVSPDCTVASAVESVRAFAEEHDEPVYNVYVLEGGNAPREAPYRGRAAQANVLVGIASIKDMLLAKSYQSLGDIVRTNMITVRPDEDQEEVARKMAKYDLNVMPVVDDSGQILGVITIDDIVDVLTAEQTEDAQKAGGMEPLDLPYFKTSFLTFIKKRGGWLFILFFGEFFTQTALRHYDPVFDAIHGAAYYVPLLISAGGNSGSQSSTLVIRGMAVGEVRLRDWWRIFLRELAMGLVLGTGLAIVGFARVLMYPEQHLNFALTVGFTLIGVVVTGCTLGSMLPIILKRFGLDPATSSTPFIASLSDVLGIIVFVHIAKIVMASVLAQHMVPP